MKYLFVHQNFPGQYLHVARRLAREPGNQVVFLTAPNENRIAGVHKVEYAFDPAPAVGVHPGARDLDLALRRADVVAGVARRLAAEGFRPDAVVGHHGWGELLGIEDVWPGVPLLGYLEFYYRTSGFDVGFDPEFPLGPEHHARIRARNAVNHLALAGPGWGQTPTEFQLSTYPAPARPRILLVREGVDLEACRPDPGARGARFEAPGLALDPGARLVTFVSRSLEPYRGFHVMMRALPQLLGARPDLHVAVVGAEGVSYGPRLAEGSWKAHFLREVEGRFDPARLHFLGRVDYADHLRLLRRSDAHVYLTYPFVASWSLREALACGCAVVGSDTEPVREFVLDGHNGLLVPFFRPDLLARRILDLFEDPWLDAHLRANARRFAERHLDLEDHLRRQRAAIAAATGLPGHDPGREDS